MKRLCFISRSGLDDAPYADIALPALAADGWEIDVFSPRASRSILRAVRPYAARCFDLHAREGLTERQREIELFATLWKARRGGYDVIYVNSQSLSVRAYLALLGMRAKKVVYHNPDFYDPKAHALHAVLERRFTRRAHLYINNEFHRGYITATFYGATCPVLTAPPNLPACWPIAERSPRLRAEMCGAADADAFVLMLHGAYSELRMVPQLLEALALLPDRFRLVMTNRDHRRNEADASIARLGLQNRVVRLPGCAFDEMLRYSVNADAGVLFYQNNDLGNFFTAPGRLTEYLACGLPVIGTNHSGLENLILRYGLGVATDTTSPRHIAGGLLELEGQVRRGEHRDSRRRFLDHFAFDHWEAPIVAAFNALLDEKAPAASGRPAFPWLPKP